LQTNIGFMTSFAFTAICKCLNFESGEYSKYMWETLSKSASKTYNKLIKLVTFFVFQAASHYNLPVAKCQCEHIQPISTAGKLCCTILCLIMFSIKNGKQHNIYDKIIQVAVNNNSESIHC